MSNDYKHITCRVTLIVADALAPEQLISIRNNQSDLSPLSEEEIDKILDSWKTKLRREIPKHKGYFILGYES